jgi:tellurite resistance protein
MEFICGAFIVIGIIGAIKNLFDGDSSSSSSSSGSSSSSAGQSYGSSRPRPSMSQFELRATHVMRGKNKDLRVISVEGRGLLPVHRTMDIEFVTWAEDVTDDADGEPILCSLTNFQHHEHPTFQNVQDGGTISPNQGYVDWVELGVAPLDALTFPRSGSRNLRFYCFMTEKTAPNLRKSLVGDSCHLRVTTTETGYKEWKEKRIEALTLSLRLGIAMAHADGDFARTEAAAIKQWLKGRVERLDDEEQPVAKEKLNSAMQAAVAEAGAGRLDVASAARNLRASPIRNASYDALELCTIIMAADGVIDPAEMRLLRQIGEQLGISAEDLQGLTDKNTPQATTIGGDGELSDELLVGLDPKLPPAEARRKLREIFARYNSMLTTERDAFKRQRYQDCIDAVARLRKKYG